MVRIKLRNISIMIAFGTILTFVVYLFCSLVCFRETNSIVNFSWLHSFPSPLFESPIVGKMTTNDQTDKNVITIDRDLFNYLSYHLRDATYGGVENYTRFMTAHLGLKELTDVEPLVTGMGPVINDVTSFQYPISIAPCRVKVNNNRNERTLFVAVISAPNNFEKRATIRSTWPSHLKNQSNINRQLNLVGFGFIVGLTKNKTVQQKLTEESARHNDILQVNVYDKYRNLSVKAAGLLNWLNSRCSQVDFVLKVDDDVYVNVHNLATVLHSFLPSEPSVYGRKIAGGSPLRNHSKWPSSFEEWPWSRVPNYLQGAGIVIAGSAVRSLLAAVQSTPYFIWDDIYLIGLCAVKAQLKLLTSNKIFVDRPENPPAPCFVRSSVMWTSPSADHMNSSHMVTQHFYQSAANQRYCVFKTYLFGPNETLGALVDSQISESALASEFNFRPI
ncbi:lactosylceramide 1,3-N-acetyl-beta-D-glucosaminyltransferase A-like [Daphnia pulicaria]|uniref:lactosylceramide 1,3-N-acetyl-beta-D-glucosaminyltransferase A-like n=1 Tax=Daphnia pulicaria TaxID=35523 RepID=UPI001EEB14E1|nr:lactosylceramide 1,3-N-acetyl-beta-D-glucosaminyltransferase A-like [Daphnia pulicaria]